MKPRQIRIDGALAYVPLSKGQEAIVDAADVALVEGVNWNCHKGYAVRCLHFPDGSRSTVYMHRVVNGTPSELFTDHIDGNKLNNCRANLRNATKKQNAANVGLRSTNRSGFKGVSWNKRDGLWQAHIYQAGKRKFLGYYVTAEEAFAEYQAVAKMQHGEFARLA